MANLINKIKDNKVLTFRDLIPGDCFRKLNNSMVIFMKVQNARAFNTTVNAVNHEGAYCDLREDEEVIKLKLDWVVTN